MGALVFDRVHKHFFLLFNITEAQEDVLACYDYRSLSFIGNRLLYACQDKHWWIEGHSIILILLKYSVPFYRYTEAGKPLSCITAINISLQANSIDTAYSTLLRKCCNFVEFYFSVICMWSPCFCKHDYNLKFWNDSI